MGEPIPASVFFRPGLQDVGFHAAQITLGAHHLSRFPLVTGGLRIA